MLDRPSIALLKVAVPIVVLFMLGLLPWIDNWAHVSGFLFGFLLAFALLPYVSFGVYDRRRKLIGIILSLGGAIFLFVILVVLFYVLPLYNCPGCQYFNCIPFTPDFCKNMEINIDRNATYSSAVWFINQCTVFSQYFLFKSRYRTLRFIWADIGAYIT